MARGLFFDGEGKFESDGGNVNSLKYKGRDDVALNPPSMPTLIAGGVKTKYWKIVLIAWQMIDGVVMQNDVAEMSQVEKDAVDQAEADEQAALEEARKDIDNLEKATKTLAKLSFEEINKLRANAGLSEYTWAQFKTAFKAEWNN